MTCLSLILGTAAFLAAGEPSGSSASRQPLEVLPDYGATLDGNVLTISSAWKGLPEDLALLRDLPREVVVDLPWSLFVADETRYLRGVRLKTLHIDQRDSTNGLETLRQCGAIEEVVMEIANNFSGEVPPADWLLDGLKGIPGLRKLTLKGCRELTLEELARVIELTDLEELELDAPAVSAENLARLSDLVRLKKLVVNDPDQLDATWLANLPDLPSLETVSLMPLIGGNCIGGLKHLAGLRSLEIGALTTYPDISQIAELGDIESFALVYASPGDNGLKLDLGPLADLPRLRSLKLKGIEVSDDDLRFFASLANLESLDVECPGVTDDGVTQLRRLTKLKSLGALGPGVTDQGVAYLAELSNLESLDLSRTAVTDAGLVPLRRLTKLKSLALDRTGITDAGIRNLVGLRIVELPSSNGNAPILTYRVAPTALESLSLLDTKVSAKGLQYLGFLPKLESLKATGTQMTNTAVEWIARFQGLRSLTVGGRQITVDGLPSLARFPSLESFELITGPSLSPGDIARIRSERATEQPFLAIKSVANNDVVALRIALEALGGDMVNFTSTNVTRRNTALRGATARGAATSRGRTTTRASGTVGRGETGPSPPMVDDEPPRRKDAERSGAD